MALTYTFSTITAGQTDADSIINQTLMDSIRQNLYHFQDFCYGVLGTYTPDTEHNHDGNNSAPVPSLGSPLTVATFREDENTVSVSWVDSSYKIKLTLPAAIKYMKWRVRGWSGSTVDALFRLKVDTLTSTSQTTQSTTAVWLTEGQLDVSSLAGQDVECIIQFAGTGGYSANMTNCYMTWTSS